MASKCVHKGCGKVFSDPDEPCVYHPGPPEFHEGTKGWKCCKPRVLTFDEFLTIPPCTTGKHSTTDDTPKPNPTPSPAASAPAQAPESLPRAPAPIPRAPRSSAAAVPSAPKPAAPGPESEDDHPSVPIPTNKTCRRRACGVSSTVQTSTDRSSESCVFHPGQPVFHEGSKGWSCCKRRVLEFDAFMKIEGCTTKDRHMFVGSGKKKSGGGSGAADGGEERLLESVRHDFYQTPTQVHASLFLKKIVKDKAVVKFEAEAVDVDLPTAEGTRYRAKVPLWGPIDPEKSQTKVLGTKLELVLAKADGRGWPVLRADEKTTGEIIQAGKAGRA